MEPLNLSAVECFPSSPLTCLSPSTSALGGSTDIDYFAVATVAETVVEEEPAVETPVDEQPPTEDSPIEHIAPVIEPPARGRSRASEVASYPYAEMSVFDDLCTDVLLDKLYLGFTAHKFKADSVVSFTGDIPCSKEISNVEVLPTPGPSVENNVQDATPLPSIAPAATDFPEKDCASNSETTLSMNVEQPSLPTCISEAPVLSNAEEPTENLTVSTMDIDAGTELCIRLFCRLIFLS